jgi:hypothetical protein
MRENPYINKNDPTNAVPYALIYLTFKSFIQRLPQKMRENFTHSGINEIGYKGVNIPYPAAIAPIIK